MTTEIDHIFICTSFGGTEASSLATFGLIEGAPNAHPGQGTACRRFFFANGYLELLWISNAAEAQSETIEPTRLWERWTGRASGACPFGFAFRPGVPVASEAPFNSWEYRPPYLPAPLCLRVATNSNVLTEPMIFYLPFRERPDNYPSVKRQVVSHPAGLLEITRVVLASPHTDELSAEMKSVRSARLIQLCVGAEYLVEIGFDGELQGGLRDFRPLLPLVFRW